MLLLITLTFETFCYQAGQGSERKAHKRVSLSHYLVSPIKLGYVTNVLTFPQPWNSSSAESWPSLTAVSEFARHQLSFLEPKLSQHFLEAMTVTPTQTHLAVLSVTFKLASREGANKQRRRERRAARSGPSFQKVWKFCREQMPHCQPPLISVLRVCLSHMVSCQRGCDNNGQ